MRNFVSFNGKPVDSSDARISAFSAAALYGKGVFTTIAIFDFFPFLWDKHWSRLTENAARLGIPIGDYVRPDLLEAVTANSLEELLGDNDCRTGRARITFFDTRASELWPNPFTDSVSLLITTAEFRPTPHEPSLTVSPYRINSASPLSQIKSCNYLDRLIALHESRKAGFHEAVQLNERGTIASGCMSNLFWMEGGQLFTPSLETGCIPGTTREFVLENLECEETFATLETLEGADAIFLTSAGLGVVPVYRFGERRLRPTEHEIMTLVPPRSDTKNTRNRSE